MVMGRLNLDPMANFRIGDGAVTLTELGQQFAGDTQHAAHARGEMLAGMTIRIMNLLDADTAPAGDAAKSQYLYDEVMVPAAEAAQPPLSDADKVEFLAGAHKALIGGNA